MPSAAAVRRNAATASGPAGGNVRSSPILASIIMAAAHIPVSKDTSAFQSSASVRGARSMRHPSPSGTTSCSGSRSSMAPRATAAAARSRPNSGSEVMDGCNRPASESAWTPA
jgi:hypothetical protein